MELRTVSMWLLIVCAIIIITTEGKGRETKGNESEGTNIFDVFVDLYQWLNVELELNSFMDVKKLGKLQFSFCII